MHSTGAVQQKGGVGKTSITAGAAGALAARGRRVLLGDVDPQGHLTVSALGMERVPREAPSLAGQLSGDASVPARELVVRHTSLPNGGCIDLLPSSLRMFTTVRDLDKRPDRERQLSRILEELAEDYDECLLDAPPSLDILTDNVLAAADGLLIPVQPDDTSIEALRILASQIRALEQALRRPPVALLGLVLSAYRRPLSTIDQTVVDALDGLDWIEVIAHMPLAAIVKEAQRSGVPVPLAGTAAARSATAEQCHAIADVLDHAAGRAVPTTREVTA